MMKLNSFVKRILTCALAAATIATAMPAYTYAEEAEDEVIVVEEDNDEITQDVEETTDVVDEILSEDAGDEILSEDDGEVWFSWNRGLIITVTEPADIAGQAEAGKPIAIKKGTKVTFTIDRMSHRYAILAVKYGGQNVAQNADGSCSVVVGDESEIRIETEERNKVTFESPDNAEEIAVTPLSSKDFEPESPFNGYIYLRPNASIRWVYKPNEGYSVTRVTKVEGSGEIELKPVGKPKKKGEVGIYELKNVTGDVKIRRYSKKDGEEPEEPPISHTLTLNNASDYNRVVINGKDVNKGQSIEFNDEDGLRITGLGWDDAYNKNWSTYFVKWTCNTPNREPKVEYEYRDAYFNSAFFLNPKDDIDITVEGRRLSTDAITAKGNIDSNNYKITTNIASQKNNYVNIAQHRANTKVTFGIKKTGSVNYEIASCHAKIRYGAGEPEEITLKKEKNSYSYEIPFDRLARFVYSEESPKIEFEIDVAAKLPAPTVKVASTTDTGATLSIVAPNGTKDLSNLWYKVEAEANLAKGKVPPEGMKKVVEPLYVPANESGTTSLDVYLMEEEGKERGAGNIQKYDFTVTMLQYDGPERTNIVGKSPEKKVSGTTSKPGYEEKLGLKKVKNAFILGETDITLATPKFSTKTYPDFRKVVYAEITTPGSTDPVRTSDTEDDSKKITIDENNNIILEDSNGLTVGEKYTLSVWPESKDGGKSGKPATLALTVKQGIDDLTLTMTKTSYVKKDNKALTISAPKVTYNGGDSKKAPFKKLVKWELIEKDSALEGKISINNKGVVTVDKDLTIPAGETYKFRINATPDDYDGNPAEPAKTDVIELTAEEKKPSSSNVEFKIFISDEEGRIDKSDIELTGVENKSGKMYVTGEEIRVRIKKEGVGDFWGASIEIKPGNAVINGNREGEYVCFSSDVVRAKMKNAKSFNLTVYF